MARKFLLLSSDETHLIDGNTKHLHTKSGMIKLDKLKENKIVRSHLGKKFVVVKPTLNDILEKAVKRTAQVILPKDLAMILAYTGIGEKGKVLDAGTGTGYTAIFLANFLPDGEIITYENNRVFLKTARKNVELSGMRNVKLKYGDVTKGINEKNLDLIILDLHDAVKAVKSSYKSLKYGGHIVIYSPTIDHLSKTIKAVKKESFRDIKIVESIVRNWQSEKTLRPKTIGLMHTGFLTFARKVI